jgi:hypothetical protein
MRRLSGSFQKHICNKRELIAILLWVEYGTTVKMIAQTTKALDKNQYAYAIPQPRV